VNVAVRLESLANPGGICISNTVHDQVSNKLALNYADFGEQSVRISPSRFASIVYPPEGCGECFEYRMD